MKVIIDRFEGEMAVLELESGDNIDVPRSQIPSSASEGDVLIKSSDDSFVIDKEETNKLRKEINDLMNKLFVD